MSIETAANNFYKYLGGKIEFETVEKHLEKLGYKILFFNSPVGDAELKRYGQTEKAKTSKAFTYSGTAKIIFIDNFLSAEDKLYVLLHEAAHIKLKHLELDRLSTHNSILLDTDADAFVYFLLSKKHKPLLPLIVFLVVGIAVACIVFLTSASQTSSRTDNSATKEVSDFVLITAAGSHYHRESCGAINGHLTAKIKSEEAQKLFSPCTMCNP